MDGPIPFKFLNSFIIWLAPEDIEQEWRMKFFALDARLVHSSTTLTTDLNDDNSESEEELPS